jgi:hypothetical protein
MTRGPSVCVCCLALFSPVVGTGCGDKGGPIGPKTEQAVGVGMMGVGAATATVAPPAGIAIAAVGAGVSVHGAYREEQQDKAKRKKEEQAAQSPGKP